jgi:hypothetical protein
MIVVTVDWEVLLPGTGSDAVPGGEADTVAVTFATPADWTASVHRAVAVAPDASDSTVQVLVYRHDPWLVDPATTLTVGYVLLRAT